MRPFRVGVLLQLDRLHGDLAGLDDRVEAMRRMLATLIAAKPASGLAIHSGGAGVCVIAHDRRGDEAVTTCRILSEGSIHIVGYGEDRVASVEFQGRRLWEGGPVRLVGVNLVTAQAGDQIVVKWA